MTIKLVVRSVLLASALLMITSETVAQGLGPASPTSGGRRTDLEYLDKGFDLELGGLVPPGFGDNFWSTPEGRARYEQLQMERFQENVMKLSELGKEDWIGQYDRVSERQVRRDFEDRAEDLEDVTEEIIEFFEWRFDVEPLEVEEPSEDSVRSGLVELRPMVEQIVETIETFQGGGIQVEQFVEMRENLAHIYELSRVARD